MIPMPIRGDKSQVRILRDGQQIAWTYLTNLTYNETSRIDEHYPIGRKKPIIETLQMGWEGQMNGLVINSDIDRMLQDLRDANRSGVAVPVMNIVYTERYPDGSIETFLFTGVKFILGNRAAGGANETITKTVNFKADDLRIIS